jgi:hypothetical protein
VLRIPQFFANGGPSEGLWGARLVDALQTPDVQSYLADEIQCNAIEVAQIIDELLTRAGGVSE